jgi:hypothetical protein
VTEVDCPRSPILDVDRPRRSYGRELVLDDISLREFDG